MTPANLVNLYMRFRQRVAMHVPNACADVSVALPEDLHDELAFYRLVNWAYVLVNEAAKIPLAFLMNLPPLRADMALKRETGFLRTYVAHNLDVSSTHDRKTLAFAQSWFRTACGNGSPRKGEHFKACCLKLADRLVESIDGAIAACDLLDDPTDGPRLVADLTARVDLTWEAHRFDPIVAACAADLGNPSLDLIAIRTKHLDAWRKALVAADENNRDRALKLRIEEALLRAIGEALPVTTREASQRLGIAGPAALTAALLLLRDAKAYGGISLGPIIERVAELATTRDAVS